MAKQGKVYLIGSGPGDPGLITLKGYQLIQKAEVILYDHLIPFDLLDVAQPEAEKISVGKFASKHTLPQEGINDLLVQKAREGKQVVRLKGGDCYLFGRGGEEAQACVEAGIPFEVVPGITSALAVPCYAGIPPTHRDFTPHVAIVTGHRKEGERIDVPAAGTVVLLMSVGNLPNIVKQLLADGWDAQTPIAAIEHGTRYDQRTVAGVLETFVETAEKAQLRTPAIFVLGRVVELRDQLDWFGKKKNVLVMGNQPQRYEYLGNIIHRRIIDCVGIDDYSQVDEQIKQGLDVDWVVFTSIRGTQHLCERLFALGKDVRALGSTKIAAIGQSTAKRLREYGLCADLIANIESSGGLLEAFAQQDVTGKRFLLPCAEVTSEELPEGLRQRGAHVDTMVVYKTVDIDPGEIDFDYIDQILFTSGSTVKAFVKYYGQVPDGIQAWALGGPTQSVAREHGIEAEIVPKDME
ncbi:uroporphyrinogen-III C-methyltransferase [Planctomycetota bacterium]